MKIYVAGKTHDIRTVRTVQKLAVNLGHEITHDWTKAVEENGGPANERGVPVQAQAQYAQGDAAGVYRADLVIVCGHPNLCGTLIEMGMALAWGKLVWTVGRFERESVFFHMPPVTRVAHISDLPMMLEHRSDKFIERNAAPSYFLND